jgi:DNA-binding response OmpR family regulator
MPDRAIRPKLLLVEDDRATYTALRGILSLRGWDVTVATTIADATLAVGQGATDAVILDLMLPDGDGTSLLETIRRKSPGATVIVTTGTGDDYRLAAAAHLAPTVLLRKPIVLADLLKALAPAA